MYFLLRKEEDAQTVSNVSLSLTEVRIVHYTSTTPHKVIRLFPDAQ